MKQSKQRRLRNQGGKNGGQIIGSQPENVVARPALPEVLESSSAAVTPFVNGDRIYDIKLYKHRCWGVQMTPLRHPQDQGKLAYDLVLGEIIFCENTKHVQKF